MSKLTTLFILAILFLVPHAQAVDNGHTETRYGISIVAEPAQALVFIDGRFIGQSRPGSPLKAILKKGEVQVRLTSAGYLDSVHTVKLKSNKLLSFKCTLVSASKEDDWQTPAMNVVLASGQTARGVITKSKKITYIIDSKGVPHQFICGLKAHPTFRVFDSKGKEVKVTRLKSRVNGAPGYKYWEYKGGAPGPHRLEISGDVGHFAFHLVTQLPDICETTNPRLKGRRKAPKLDGK